MNRLGLWAALGLGAWMLSCTTSSSSDPSDEPAIVVDGGPTLDDEADDESSSGEKTCTRQSHCDEGERCVENRCVTEVPQTDDDADDDTSGDDATSDDTTDDDALADDDTDDTSDDDGTEEDDADDDDADDDDADDDGTEEDDADDDNTSDDDTLDDDTLGDDDGMTGDDDTNETSPWTDCYPFDQPAPARLRASDKKVFAWYFPPYPLSFHNGEPDSDWYERWLDPAGGGGEYVDTGGHLRDRPFPRPARPESHWRQLDFEVEVRQAIAAGLDGFILEMTWRETHADSRWNQTQAMLDAAQAVDPEFRILLSPGFPTQADATSDELRDTILRFAHHPAVLYLPDGRLPLSTFYPERPSTNGGKPLSWWQDLWEELREDHDLDVAWVPHLQSRTSRNNLANLEDWHDTIAGYSIWDGKFASQASFNISEAAYASERGLLWFAHALFQDARLRKADLVELRHWESSGSATFRAFFEAAITGDVDFVSIITWNDYGETQIAPSVARGHAVVDLLAYYTTWFKTGERPTVLRDTLYYFHRKQPVDAPYDMTQQTAGQYVIPAGPGGEDNVELLAFLTEPGSLIITQGTDVQMLEVDEPGMVSFVVPLVADATPSFTLSRDEQVVISLESKSAVQSEVIYQDMTLQADGSLQCQRPD